MHHHDRNRKFGRENDIRRAFIRSITEALALHGKIQTTEARAKEIRPFIERLITIAKRGTPAASKMLVSRLGTKKRAALLVAAAKSVGARSSGYTRITKLGPRTSDSSPMAIIEVIKAA